MTELPQEDCDRRKTDPGFIKWDARKNARYVQRDGPDLMSKIGGIHPLLGELKLHVQGGMIWSETKLVI